MHVQCAVQFMDHQHDCLALQTADDIVPITHASSIPVRLSGGLTGASAENEPDETAAKVRANLFTVSLASIVIAGRTSGSAMSTFSLAAPDGHVIGWYHRRPTSGRRYPANTT